MAPTRRALLLAAPAAALATARAQTAPPPDTVTMPLTAAPSVLIPGISPDPAARLLGAKIYRGLMQWRPDGTLEPGLAAAVESTPDGLSHTFHLRPDVIWHDSGGLVAADVLFSLGKFHPALQPRLALDRLRLEAPDPGTAVVRLPEPDPAFLRLLDASVLPIVPQHVHDRPGWAIDPRATTPVGTGPFRVAGWLRLVRFAFFAGPHPALAAIDCPILPDPAARAAQASPGLLLAGAAVDRAAVPGWRGRGALAVAADASPGAAGSAGLRLNTNAKPLDRVELRQALAGAIDRAAALREGWAGFGAPATGPLPGGTGLPPFDLRAASGRLTAAGLRPDENGIRAQLRMLLSPDDPWASLFPFLQASLARIGVDLAADAVTAADWPRRVAAGDYQIAGFSLEATGDPRIDLASYLPDVPDLAEPLRSGDIAGAQALLLARMPRVWLVEPAIPLVRDKRLALPGGALGSFAAARFE